MFGETDPTTGPTEEIPVLAETSAIDVIIIVAVCLVALALLTGKKGGG